MIFYSFKDNFIGLLCRTFLILVFIVFFFQRFLSAKDIKKYELASQYLPHNENNKISLGGNTGNCLARLYKSTDRAIAVTTALASASTLALLKIKFLVKVFKCLYLLNPWMDLVYTFPDVRYWYEVLCCTIKTHISDLEVKVTDFDILS